MSTRTLNLNDALYSYLLDVSVREPPLLARLRRETARHPRGRMQISPEQGQLLRFLLRLMGARRALEIGVFTGYSTLCMALALPQDGRITACDVSAEWTAVGQRYWEEAGVAAKIDLRIAPAEETLSGLIGDGQEEQYDFAFIDADKTGYRIYFEQCMKLVRPGGLIAVDNTLWSGSVIDSSDQSADTIAIRAFNERLQADQRIELSLVPIGDGLSLAMKHVEKS